MTEREQVLASVQETFAQTLAVVERKNRDYSTAADAFANFRGALLLGQTVPSGMLLRIADKLVRINNLLERPAAVLDEPLEDSISDAIGYLGLLKAFLELQPRRLPLSLAGPSAESRARG